MEQFPPFHWGPICDGCSTNSLSFHSLFTVFLSTVILVIHVVMAPQHSYCLKVQNPSKYGSQLCIHITCFFRTAHSYINYIPGILPNIVHKIKISVQRADPLNPGNKKSWIKKISQYYQHVTVMRHKLSKYNPRGTALILSECTNSSCEATRTALSRTALNIINLDPLLPTLCTGSSSLRGDEQHNFYCTNSSEQNSSKQR